MIKGFRIENLKINGKIQNANEGTILIGDFSEDIKLQKIIA